MNKIQKLNFRNTDEFLDYLPEDELLIIEALRSLIFECIPDITEKLSYNVPFYSRTKTMCYLWPASVPWGNVRDKQVILGFSQGIQLPDPFKLLEKGTRKQIRTISFQSLDDFNPDQLRFYLFEALDLDKKN